MCVVSNVHDYFMPLIPNIVPMPTPIPLAPQPSLGLTAGTWVIDGVIISREEADRIRSLIADFRTAVEAARVVDKLTAQPDCADPAKLKLEDRVTAIEKRLDALFGAIAKAT